MSTYIFTFCVRLFSLKVASLLGLCLFWQPVANKVLSHVSADELPANTNIAKTDKTSTVSGEILREQAKIAFTARKRFFPFFTRALPALATGEAIANDPTPSDRYRLACSDNITTT